MKEMVGGCCVCSDERGWDENPLVYCDGQGCNVAVHQACYGIVTVPSGPWYCRKCESQERSARVRCELCPSRDGALKKTDSNGWAHVVCALYIPEVRFGNVTTMEPILISLIPSERFNKTCYICDDKREKASVGACMQCNKAGCKQNFHVTCAQYKGLLCEEAGNMMDNVKYCGYCDYHYGKLKKTSNMKIIPPFKPIPSNVGESPASSPEKTSQKQGAGTESSVSHPHSSVNTIGSTTTAGNVGSNASASVSNPNISPDINSTSKNSGNSKPSLKKATVTNNGKHGSTANNNSSSSSTNSSTNPSPIPRIQPSNLFSSGAFSTSLGVSRHLPDDKGKALVIKSEEDVAGSGGKGSTEDSHGHSHRSSSGKTPSSFSMKTKDYTTLSVSDVVTAALDRPMASKFDISSSTNLTAGIEPTVSLPVTTSHRVDKPPPDIKPHVTLTPIPMRSSDEPKVDSRTSKSPALTFPSTFGQTPKLHTTQTSPEVSEREKKSKTEPDMSLEALTPAKRPRHGPDNYDSDTESASESWPTRQEEESESQSQSGSQSRTDLHLSRKERYIGSHHQQSMSPARMLTPQQAQDMAHWESSSRSPQVTLERMRFSGREGSPFNSKMYSADYIPKRGPGRPVKRRSGTSRDDENSDMKIPTRSRGRRGGSASINACASAPYPRRENRDSSGLNCLNNGNGGSIEDRENSFEDQPHSLDSASTSLVSSGRGGRHAGLGRSSKVVPTNSSNNLPKKPNYDEAPTMTFAQLKAQTSATTDKVPAHMFGNLLNPASSMAQKMVDSLSQEMETIAEVTDSITPQTQLVGITFPVKSSSAVVVPTNGPQSVAAPPAAPPQTLEELLERQWEQGSQFLMEQAQHLDIAQLLSCLNQLKQDNRALEEHVASLIQRKEHLSAINARLSIPLGSSSTLVSLGPAYCNPGTGNHGTPPLGSQGHKNTSVGHNGSAVPSPQLQQQILQETAVHQARIPTHPFPGTEILGPGHPQSHPQSHSQSHHGHGHSHRSHNSNSGQGQIFGFPGHGHPHHVHNQSGGLTVPVSHAPPSQHAQNSHSHHPPMPRDSR